MFRRFLSLPLLAVLFTLLAPTASQAAADPVGSYASGGGCRNTNDVGSCVSYSSLYKRVSGDFYLNSNNWTSCTARLWLNVNGTWHPKYLVVLDHVGGEPYPEKHHYVSGSGWAFTEIDLYDCGGRYQYSARSPTIYYP